MLGFVEIDEVADEQIESSVVVVIEPYCAGSPARSGDARVIGHIGNVPLPLL